MTARKIARDPGREIWALVRSVNHLMNRLRTRELAGYGLTVPQAGVLRHVQELGARATPTTLARAMFRQPTSVSAILTRMEKQGLVKRVQGQARKNQVCIELTPKGKQLRRQALMNETVSRVMARLSPAALARLESDLGTFRKCVIDQMAEGYRGYYTNRLKREDPPLE